MSSQSTAARALEAARAARTSQQVYAEQVRQYLPAAMQAFEGVIWPWWVAFTASPEARHIRRWLVGEQRRRTAIADPVRYIDAQGKEWEATVMLEPAQPPARSLLLRVQQLPGGRPVSSYAGALLAHQMRRRIPEAIDELCSLDLHPVVLIDFAEQLQAGTVGAHIQALVADS